MIERKKCKCKFCQENPEQAKWPTLSCQGYFYDHLPDDLKEKAGTKRRVQQKNFNRMQRISTMSRMAQKKADGTTEKKELWFMYVRQRMSGICECGCLQPSSKNNDKYFRFSSAHLLAKSLFPSVQFHPMNYLELSYFNNCHSIYDDKGYEYCKIHKPSLWKIVVERFRIIFKDIAENERRRIPQVLLDELLTNEHSPTYSPTTVSKELLR